MIFSTPSMYAGLLGFAAIFGVIDLSDGATALSSLPKKWRVQEPFTGDYDTFAELRQAVQQRNLYWDTVRVLGRKGETVDALQEFGNNGTFIDDWRKFVLEGEATVDENETPFTIDCSRENPERPFLRFKTYGMDRYPASQWKRRWGDLIVEKVTFRNVRILNQKATFKVANTLFELESCRLEGTAGTPKTALEVTVDPINPWRYGRPLFDGRQPGVRVRDTTFVNRDAGDGSVIVVYSKSMFAEVEVRDSVFQNNRGGDGAALRVMSSSRGAVQIWGTHFERNRSTGKGGAIAIYPLPRKPKVADPQQPPTDPFAGDFDPMYGPDPMMDFPGFEPPFIGDTSFACRSCTFRQNSAQGKGGAIYMTGAQDSVFFLDDTTVESNSVGGNAGTYSGDYEAGAVVVKARHFRVQNSRFTENQQDSTTSWTNPWVGAGALSVEVNGEHGRVLLLDSTFTSNRGGKTAVLVRTSDSPSSVQTRTTVTGNQFYDNQPQELTFDSHSPYVNVRDLTFVPSTLASPATPLPARGALELKNNVHFSRNSPTANFPAVAPHLPFVDIGDSYQQYWENVYFDNNENCQDTQNDNEAAISELCSASGSRSRRILTRQQVGCLPYKEERSLCAAIPPQAHPQPQPQAQPPTQPQAQPQPQPQARPPTQPQDQPQPQAQPPTQP